MTMSLFREPSSMSVFGRVDANIKQHSNTLTRIRELPCQMALRLESQAAQPLHVNTIVSGIPMHWFQGWLRSNEGRTIDVAGSPEASAPAQVMVTVLS